MGLVVTSPHPCNCHGKMRGLSPSKSMEFSVRQIAGVTIFDLVGRLVATAEGQTLHGLLETAEKGPRWILVNCAGLSYVDSSGLGDLVAALAATVRRGGVLRLLNPSPRLRELLALAGIDTLLDVYDDEPAALASFNAMGNLRARQKLTKYLEPEH